MRMKVQRDTSVAVVLDSAPVKVSHPRPCILCISSFRMRYHELDIKQDLVVAGDLS